MNTLAALLSLASVALAAAAAGPDAYAGNNNFHLRRSEANPLLAKRACAGNNCNRAITGTRDGLPATSLRQADCSSFLLTTVTPSAVTATYYVDASDVPASASSLPTEAAATVVPSVLPTYATHCSSAAAYASACLCWGITASVTTAPVPTVTVTSAYDDCEL